MSNLQAVDHESNITIVLYVLENAGVQEMRVIGGGWLAGGEALWRRR